MSSNQGLLRASGALLSRVCMGEGDLWLTFFLKGEGLLRASAKGAERGRVRFGGATEPLTWGVFQLHRGRSGGRYLSGADIADDMISLRRSPKALMTAVRWARLVIRHLPPGHPADDLLANLYWNMKLLSEPGVPPELADWRFCWRWLISWGLAPDLTRCERCQSPLFEGAWTGEGWICPRCAPGAAEERPVFSEEELKLLRQTAGLTLPQLRQLGEQMELARSAGLFSLASRCAEGLLSQDIREV